MSAGSIVAFYCFKQHLGIVLKIVNGCIFQNDGEETKLNMVVQTFFASHHNCYCLINQSLISCCDFRNILQNAALCIEDLSLFQGRYL